MRSESAPEPTDYEPSEEELADMTLGFVDARATDWCEPVEPDGMFGRDFLRYRQDHQGFDHEALSDATRDRLRRLVEEHFPRLDLVYVHGVIRLEKN